MPPAAIIFRVFLFFIFIAGTVLAVIFLLSWLLANRAKLAAAKVDSERIVSDVETDLKAGKYYKEAVEKIKKMQK